MRGYSIFGISFVYVIFEDGTDLYWARSRVLEYGSTRCSRGFPPGAKPSWAPTPPASAGSSSTRWRVTGLHDLAELRTIQDWFVALRS